MIDEKKLTDYLMQQYDRCKEETDRLAAAYLPLDNDDPEQGKLHDEFMRTVGRSLMCSEIFKLIVQGKFNQ
jgi:hypothetical protein